jgi:hypothetical protein
MSFYRSWRSLTAVLLVLAVPGVSGALLFAHARDGRDQTMVWTDHTSNQKRVHDHGICVQLQRLTQAPSDAAPSQPVTPPTTTGSQIPPSFACVHQVPSHVTLPRAPPASA